MANTARNNFDDMLQDLAVRIDNMHKDFSPHKISLEVANHLLLSLWKASKSSLCYDPYSGRPDFNDEENYRWRI
uniref:Uncharacterized protein n=1 Tax=Meloidogyne enterolobii TaxID=390850 RepID=A0A6V7VHI2_MELEN|nr:unnamed protein product [Meloidogyne enterolobii]